jgi:hypothetical protein
VQLRFGFEAPLAQFQALGPVWAATNSAFLRGTGAEPAARPELGMSRAVVEPSFGQHFVPLFNATRDFMPENEREKKALAALEDVPLQAGFYFFGRAIVDAPMAPPNYRALKGPAAITEGTPRPAWYPTAINPAASADALPDWKTIYPVAQKAMKRFAEGGTGFETSIGSWQIAARPILASQQRCVACHNAPGFATRVPAELNHALGGVLYAFRRTSI